MTKLSLLPVYIDVELVAGTDNEVEALLRDGAGVAQDITDDTVELTARKTFDGALMFTITNGPADHINPAAGRTRFVIPRADVPTAGSYRYEVRRVWLTGEQNVYLAGVLKVVPTPAP